MSLKHALLSLLTREPKTGYELAKVADESTGFFWSASHQQIYRELAELKKKTWVKDREVEQTEKPDKKIYSTTKAGLAELRRWAGEETEVNSSKDAFLIKLFSGELVKPELLLSDLLKQKENHRARLAKYREIQTVYFKNTEKLPVHRQFQNLTLKRGVYFEKAWLAWCHDVECFLRSRIKF